MIKGLFGLKIAVWPRKTSIAEEDATVVWKLFDRKYFIDD